MDAMQQQLLTLINNQDKGIGVPEVMSATGLDYSGLMDAVNELCTRGHRIGIIKIGQSVSRIYPVRNRAML